MTTIFHNREIVSEVPAGYESRPFNQHDVRLAQMSLEDMSRRGDSSEARMEQAAWVGVCTEGARRGWLITVPAGSRPEPVIE